MLMTDKDRVLLTFDVGNSSTAIGVADPTSLTIRQTWRLATRPDRPPDEWRALLSPLLADCHIDPRTIVGVAVSSVVPAITRSMDRLSRDWLETEPIVVSAHAELGIAVSVDHPSDVGADRLANAAAAHALYGGPVIVVDAGTATKIDAVSASAEFLGGVIAPGIGIGLEALAGRAARLYAVKVALPQRAIGRNTTEAIQSGVVLGHLTMIQGMVKRVRHELGTNAPVILTGGFAGVLDQQPNLFDRVETNLTLIGAGMTWSRAMAGGSPRDRTSVRGG